jgi:large subunit ribosomal protein L17
MRHFKRGRKLNRTASHRSALLSNLASSFIMHKQITTTQPKAKELRSFAERLITYAKKDSLHGRRLILIKYL